MYNTQQTDFAPATRTQPEILTDEVADFRAHADDVMRFLLDSVPDCLLVLDENRQAVMANERVIVSLGLDSEVDVIGQRPGEMLGCAHLSEGHGCGTTEFCRTCGAARAILSSLKGQEDVEECRIMLQSGDALDLRVWARPLDVDGRRYSVFSFQDISHEKRRSALERIFFHDVMNTAGVVQGYAEMLKEMDSADPSMVEAIASASTRLMDEINAQRYLAAAENGDLRTMPVRIDPALLLMEIQHQYQHHVVSDQRSIALDLPDETATLWSDRTLLGRVLGNLVKNALEACPPESTVTLRYSLTKRAVTFSVHNPTYMPRNVQLQVFKRSFSTKGSGRGLGTYSIKLLTERYLSGSVRFETDRDNGTTFYVTYPPVWQV